MFSFDDVIMDWDHTDMIWDNKSWEKGFSLSEEMLPVYGLVQERSNSSALTMELLQSCAKHRYHGMS